MIELQVLGNDAIPLNVTETSTIPLEVTMSTGGGAVINNQDKSVTPTESVQSITADIGYTGLGTVTVGAISSDYVGSEVPRKSSADLTASGATVTAPSGYYESSASKSVASGTEGTPTASKGSVSNHSVAVTPSVTNTTGYIEGGTKTGTAVTVSASELVSGTKSVTANGTEDVTNYASVNVNVANSYSASDEGKVVNNGALVSQTSATYTTNGTYDTTTKNEVVVNVSGGGSSDTIDNIIGDIAFADFVNTTYTGANLMLDRIPAVNIKVPNATKIASGFNSKTTGVIDCPSVTSSGPSTLQNACYASVIYLPSMTSFGSNAFVNATNRMTKIVVGSAHPFVNTSLSLRNSTNLKALVFHTATSAPTLSDAALTRLQASGIGTNADGYIYVLTTAYTSFTTATNWSTVSSKIRKIEDYPLIDAPTTWLPT